jgi:hypothetical protein
MNQNFGYPKEILDFDYDKYLSLCLENTVWDINQGIILKLNPTKEITKAYKGFSPLTRN